MTAKLIEWLSNPLFGVALAFISILLSVLIARYQYIFAHMGAKSYIDQMERRITSIEFSISLRNEGLLSSVIMSKSVYAAIYAAISSTFCVAGYVTYIIPIREGIFHQEFQAYSYTLAFPFYLIGGFFAGRCSAMAEIVRERFQYAAHPLTHIEKTENELKNSAKGKLISDADRQNLLVRLAEIREKLSKVG